jgi:transposase-like protein
MRITKEQGMKIKKAILDRGYSITGFCRIHNISDRQFYAWLAGTNGYERNGIGKHFQDITDALFADKVAEDVAKEKEQNAQEEES